MSVKLDVFDTEVKQCKEDADCLLLIPGEYHGERQVIHATSKGIGKCDSYLDGTVGIVTLAISIRRGKAPMVPRSRSLNRYLPQASVSTMLSDGVCFTNSV